MFIDCGSALVYILALTNLIIQFGKMCMYFKGVCVNDIELHDEIRGWCCIYYWI